MNENSIVVTAPTTPENVSNSSMHKAKSSVSNIILNTLSSSLSKWFSPSDQNGNLRRKRETESDIELNDMAHGTPAAAASSSSTSEPPTKRFRGGQNQDEIESRPTSSKNLYSTRHFSSSTPTTTTATTGATPTRRKLLGRESSPFMFSDHTLTNARRQSQIMEPATITIDDNGDNSTDEEVIIQDDGTDSLSRELLNRKRLNIPPTARPDSRTSNLLSMRTSLPSKSRFSANHTIGHDATKDDDLEQDALFNGTANESASESEDSLSRTTFTQPDKFATKRPQSSAGRINTSFVRDDEPDQMQRRLGGLFGSKRLRGNGNGLMNFSAHLQTKSSLFSDKNMPKSLNASTTSLNSLNRVGQSSLYGSTSALSDSRLLQTNSPFYRGRTMYGGRSACPRRAMSSTRTLRVPTQIRPSSSLSTLTSSTTSLADPNTSALSSTAKRILDLMNQCTTPLADVKKMASNAANHSPALVNHRKRFDDNDMKLDRSIRLSTPRTPYTRPGVNSNKKSPPTNELQVPTMSQLLQMKKILQTNTEKVREVATASSSILNQTGEYKLPDNNDSESGPTRQSKIRNKITTTRPSTKNVQEEYVPEVNLPNISLPPMKNMPDVSLPFSKPKTTTYDVLPAAVTQPPAASTLANSTTAKPTPQSSTTKEDNSTRKAQSQFSFSSPTQLKLPLFDKNIAPINNFKFSEPIDVEKATSNTPASAFGSSVPSTALFNAKTSAVNSVKPVAPLKNASVLEALNIPKTVAPAVPSAPTTAKTTTMTTATTIPPQKSLSDLFKSSSKQWECSCCMIKNDDAKDKCVACETPRRQTAAKPIEHTLSAPLTNSFGSQFKPNANTWECSACMVRNKVDAQKCIACETPKPGALGKSVSALPKLAAPSTDQGFKSIVAQQSARWECTACMTRNDANRKKCECCEQAKPGASSDSSMAFSFGSTSSATPKFSFGVPFNEKSASTVVPISEAKPKVGEVKPSFSFGVQSNATVTDGPVNTFSFGSQSKLNDKEKKSDPPATTFSFGVKPSNASNDNDLSASTKIVSTPALSGFKFGASIPEPVTVATAVSSPSNKRAAEEPAKDTRSNELVFGSQSKNAVISVPLSVPAIPANIASTTNSTISFGSPKSDQKLPVFGTPINKLDSPLGAAQTRPTFGLTTAAASNAQTSTAQSTSLANKVTPSSVAAPVFAFGQSQNAAKGGFSFTPTPVVKEKQAFPMPDFAQSQMKPAATTLSFGSSNVTVTTAAPAAPFGSSTFFFGQAATTAPSESSTASSAFGSTPSAPASGFNFGSNSAPSQPIASTFGAPTQQQQLSATHVFPAVAPAITSSLPTEPATSSFMFRSTTNVEPAFGQSATPSFGQPNTTPIPPFGSFSSQTATPAFSANVNPIGNPLTNNAAPPAFGSSSSPFGSTVNPTPTPNFGSTGNNGLSSTFGVPSFGSPSSGFGSMIHAAPANSDEPSAKKPSPGFGALSNANIQKPPAFSFGDSSSGNSSKTSFAFSANASPSFNFSGSQPAQSNTVQPYKFGSSNVTPSPVFSFGSAEAKSPNAPFQFAGSSDVTNNPFAPQTTVTNSAATQQRRKIRARRTPR